MGVLKSLRLRGPTPLRIVPNRTLALRMGIHDLTRLEWVASVPIPPVGNGPEKYQIEFSVEMPANIYPVHNVWDHKQSFTRLKSPAEEGQIHLERIDIDELRRDTLGIARRLKLLREYIEKKCRGPAGERHTPLDSAAISELSDWVIQAVDILAEMRRSLRRPPSEHSAANLLPEVLKEWSLADEFLSHQLLDFLGAAQKAFDQLIQTGTRDNSQHDLHLTEELRCLVAEALAEELVHRRAYGYVNPDPTSPKQLSEFVDRSSRLKKHFQDVLFLDVESFMVDYRLRNWTGIGAALLAASFWLTFTLLPLGQGTRAGIGIGSFAILFAASYALKDRLKELTRAWIARRLVRIYGQQVVRVRLPKKLDPQRSLLLDARETFDCISTTLEDALNETVGQTQRTIQLVFRMRAEIHPSIVLERGGNTTIKHLFRYDLSPMFSRLDNAVKPIPVLDPKTRQVHFVEAPKEYRLPVSVRGHYEKGAAVEVRGSLVLSKRGIERFERER